MYNFLKKIIGDKKKWRKMEARSQALPKDYQIVYSEIKSYTWKFSAVNAMDNIAILEGLLGLFEEGAADGKRALEITGKDVAAFCDGLLRNAKSYKDNWREELNHNVMKKLGSEGKK
ncbi:MAG: DUF1048 domain-containing protein [Patescibacteria group bacterium]|jgi:DNA-binding ferritin-like protein (Dps family)